jgi:hypothetical protein
MWLGFQHLQSLTKGLLSLHLLSPPLFLPTIHYPANDFQTLYNQVCDDTNNFDILTLVDEKWPQQRILRSFSSFATTKKWNLMDFSCYS